MPTNKFKKFLWSIQQTIKELLKKSIVKEIIDNPSENTYLYFFWGKGGCDFLPFIDKTKYGKIAVRFHRYDLFKDQNNGYIPYRRKLLDSVHIAAPSSQRGYDHIINDYPNLKSNLMVSGIGVIKEGEVFASTDGVLRIVSCSFIVPVKRVHLIAEALMNVNIPVEWTHIGGGPLMNDVLDIVAKFPPNVKAIFPGTIHSLELINFYKKQPIDLFLNVSSSEGVPMSIRDSLSLGIPVIATDVGGSAQIVDDTVGEGLHPDVTSSQ